MCSSWGWGSQPPHVAYPAPDSLSSASSYGPQCCTYGIVAQQLAANSRIARQPVEIVDRSPARGRKGLRGIVVYILGRIACSNSRADRRSLDSLGFRAGIVVSLTDMITEEITRRAPRFGDGTSGRLESQLDFQIEFFDD